VPSDGTTFLPSERLSGMSIEPFASDDESFWELHRRLVERSCTTGDVSDFGPVIGFDFTDPDGMTCEVDLVLDPTLAGNHPPQPYAATARLAGHN
jgi:hypothetical protein